MTKTTKTTGERGDGSSSPRRFDTHAWLDAYLAWRRQQPPEVRRNLGGLVLVYAVLRRYPSTSTHGTFYPSLDTLAAETTLARSTVQRQLRRLVAVGFLVKLRKARGTITAKYALAYPEGLDPRGSVALPLAEEPRGSVVNARGSVGDCQGQRGATQVWKSLKELGGGGSPPPPVEPPREDPSDGEPTPSTTRATPTTNHRASYPGLTDQGRRGGSGLTDQGGGLTDQGVWSGRPGGLVSQTNEQEREQEREREREEEPLPPGEPSRSDPTTSDPTSSTSTTRATPTTNPPPRSSTSSTWAPSTTEAATVRAALDAGQGNERERTAVRELLAQLEAGGLVTRRAWSTWAAPFLVDDLDASTVIPNVPTDALAELRAEREEHDDGSTFAEVIHEVFGAKLEELAKRADLDEGAA